MEVCKWLFAHGAAKDVKRRTHEPCDYPNGRSPLYTTFGSSKDELGQWLILKGALCKGSNSENLDVETMKHDLLSRSWLVEKRARLLEWADDLHQARTSFLLFLSGALSAPQNATSTRRSSSPVETLSGNPGVLELIGDYVGFVRGREERIIRQLTETLPDFFD